MTCVPHILKEEEGNHIIGRNKNFSFLRGGSGRYGSNAHSSGEGVPLL